MGARNLLFLLTDQQRRDTFACYGNTFVQAPHLNRLAERSFVFRRAYCAQPVCTPSRATLMTGLWPHSHGCLTNNVPLREGVPTLAEMLPAQYRRAYFGKWHLGDELRPQRGFGDWLSIEDGIYRRYYSSREQLEGRSSYHRFLLDHGFDPDSRALDGARLFSRRFAARLEERFTKCAYLGHRAAEFLRERADGEPFALVVSFLEPHPPFIGPLDDLHDAEKVPVGDAFLEAPARDTARWIRRRVRRIRRRGFHRDRLRDERDWRRVRARYSGLITLLDRAVGEILEALEASGRADETLVVFTTDHGEMMGDHALMGKGVMYEEATRVPWLLRAPWLAREGRAIDGPVSQVDLVPTLLELLGVGFDDRLQGQSRAAVLEGSQSLHANSVVIEKNGRRPSDRIRSLVSPDGWKLNLYRDERPELYDLGADPSERVNRFGRPEHAERVRGMVGALREWQAATGDPLRLPEPGAPRGRRGWFGRARATGP